MARMNPTLEELATLRLVNRQMRLIVKHLPGIVGGCYDLKGNLVLMLGPHVPGVTAEEGQHYSKFLPDDRKEKFLWLFERAKDGLESSVDYPIGKTTYEATATPIFDEKSKLSLILVYVRDVTPERVAVKALKEFGAKDTMTGLGKNAVLHTFIDNLINRAAIFHVIFVDLDNLKQVNDTKGHDAGDRLIEHVAGELKGCVRSNDLVARKGGDEFVVVLTNTNAPLEAAQRILTRILRVSAPLGGGASMGLATYPIDASTRDEIIKAADTAMYVAKRAGKGRIHVANGETVEVKFTTIPPPPIKSGMKLI
jgi:diguanylate cyclase (GGDEF)-like protein